MEPTPSVTIGQPGATLTFQTDDPVGQSFVVSLDLPGITASEPVFPGHYIQGGELVDFFQGLARDWKGWEGPRGWDSYGDGNFQLTCWHDRIGHVAIQVVLGVDPVHEWHEPAWKVTAQVIVDPGSLSLIATSLAHMFEAV